MYSIAPRDGGSPDNAYAFVSLASNLSRSSSSASSITISPTSSLFPFRMSSSPRSDGRVIASPVPCSGWIFWDWHLIHFLQYLDAPRHVHLSAARSQPQSLLDVLVLQPVQSQSDSIEVAPVLRVVVCDHHEQLGVGMQPCQLLNLRWRCRLHKPKDRVPLLSGFVEHIRFRPLLLVPLAFHHV